MITREIIVPLRLPPPKIPRSVGVHASGVIRCIATEQGILKSEWAEELSLTDMREITDETAILRICIGLAWEQFYIPEVLGPTLGVEDHPGEMYVNGIYMTHDGESVDTIIAGDSPKYSRILHEVKATYKSTKTVGDLKSQWMWMAQIQAYCKGMGIRHAMMHVLFLCGDYTFPIKPKRRAWWIEFSQEEIDTNWELLVDYKNMMLARESDR